MSSSSTYEPLLAEFRDEDDDDDDPSPRALPTMKSTTLGRIRAYWLGSVVCLGGFLFGYDSGM